MAAAVNDGYIYYTKLSSLLYCGKVSEMFPCDTVGLKRNVRELLLRRGAVVGLVYSVADGSSSWKYVGIDESLMGELGRLMVPVEDSRVLLVVVNGLGVWLSDDGF